MKCSICLIEKDDADFVKRNHTSCCVDCSEKRRQKDYCEHDTRNHDCRFCGVGAYISARKTLHSCRRSDFKKGFINDLDINYTLDLFMGNTQCYYCKIELQHLYPFKKDFATIDRLNDELPHIKSNCVLACRDCNCAQHKWIHIINDLENKYKT